VLALGNLPDFGEMQVHQVVQPSLMQALAATAVENLLHPVDRRSAPPDNPRATPRRHRIAEASRGQGAGRVGERRAGSISCRVGIGLLSIADSTVPDIRIALVPLTTSYAPSWNREPSNRGSCGADSPTGGAEGVEGCGAAEGDAVAKALTESSAISGLHRLPSGCPRQRWIKMGG
jgi:hypothetical protein